MTYQYEVDLTADEKVAAYVLREYKALWHSPGRSAEAWRHLKQCPEATVSHAEGNDGMYGCDTGCEYARLEATISCPHGFVDEEFEYGAFGELADLLADLD